MPHQSITLPIYGLTHAGGGKLLLEQTLMRVPGVVHAYVNADTEMAYVKYDSDCSSPAQIIKVIKLAGFEAGKFNLH